MAITKSVSYGTYTISKEDSGKIIVTNNGEVCSNTTAALREISAKCNFDVDEKWNTQTHGSKLIAYLLENGSAAASAPVVEKKTVAAPAEEKAEPNVKGSAADIAGARVRVYGKAQNRTALGIMHSYMIMYPQAKLEDLQKAFPDSLNPDSGVKKNFIYADEQGTTADWEGYFKKDDEVLTMGDGKKVAVVSMWTKPSLERLVAWAKQYGIIIADFEASKGGGTKGGFRLEYLNGYVPPKPKKGVPIWVWIVIALLACGIAAALIFGRSGEAEVVEKVVVVHDTLYIQQIEEIENDFNAAQFQKGKADLSDDAKFVLHDL
ncbi:MAG: hypothetical protein HUK15_02610, partial [Bacteroidales bacterium]|nr:hypothetical protein [Bacteroidales bacterium]